MRAFSFLVTPLLLSVLSSAALAAPVWNMAAVPLPAETAAFSDGTLMCNFDSPIYFPGSRAKGVQPRTQEVLDDLGVLPALRSRGALYPKLGLHLGPLVIPKTMMKLQREAPPPKPFSDEEHTVTVLDQLADEDTPPDYPPPEGSPAAG